MTIALIVLTAFAIACLIAVIFKFISALHEKDKQFNNYVINSAVNRQRETDQMRKAFAEERAALYHERQLLLNRIQFIEMDDDEDGAVRGIAIKESDSDTDPAELTTVDEEREVELELAGNGEPTRETEVSQNGDA